MISFRTYLLSKGKFVPVEEFVGTVEDDRYIEGAIELMVHSTILLDRGVHDYVDQLWAYLVSGLKRVHEGNEYATNFPDQPIKVEMARLPQSELVRFRVTVDEPVEVSVPYRELARSMVLSGTAFFKRMQTIAPRNQGTYQSILDELQRLSELDTK